MLGQFGGDRLVCSWVVLLLALLALLVPTAASANTMRGHKRKATVLHLAWRQHGTAAVLLSDDRYAFAAPSNSALPGVLFDDFTRQQADVPQDGCFAAGSQIFGEVLAFQCVGSNVRLYSIESGTSFTVPVNPSVTDPCAGSPGPPCFVGASLVDAGTYWLKFSQEQPCDDHCYYLNVFQNIETGNVVSDPAHAGGDQIADLDAPQLGQTLCPPLTVPDRYQVYDPNGPGQLRLDGQFALASTTGPDLTEVYLERCGTRLEQLIGPDEVAASPHALAWEPTRNTLEIEFRPSLERFRVALPRGSGQYLTTLALTDTRLYAIDQNGKLWIAPAPARPPSRRPASGR